MSASARNCHGHIRGADDDIDDEVFLPARSSLSHFADPSPDFDCETMMRDQTRNGSGIISATAGNDRTSRHSLSYDEIPLMSSSSMQGVSRGGTNRALSAPLAPPPPAPHSSASASASASTSQSSSLPTTNANSSSSGGGSSMRSRRSAVRQRRDEQHRGFHNRRSHHSSSDAFDEDSSDQRYEHHSHCQYQHQHQCHQPSPKNERVKTSLDAGMATLRRWIRSHSSTSVATADDNHDIHDGDDEQGSCSIMEDAPPSRPQRLSQRSIPRCLEEEEADGVEEYHHAYSSWCSADSCHRHSAAAAAGTSNSSSGYAASAAPATAHTETRYMENGNRDSNRDIDGSHKEAAAAAVDEEQAPTDEDFNALLHRLNNQQPTDVMDPISASTQRVSHRARALSEPDAVRIRDYLYHRALTAPARGGRRRRGIGSAQSSSSMRQRRDSRNRQRSQSEIVDIHNTSFAHGGSRSRLSASAMDAAASQLSSDGESRRSSRNGGLANDISGNSNHNNSSSSNSNTTNVNGNVMNIDEYTDDDRDSGNSIVHGYDGSGGGDEQADPNRDARARWISINRRFQLVITVVALLFSLLLFAILVCWVVLTSAYVVSIDKSCDVPLKQYFWVVTLQLILDVFRVDIMRLVFRWDASSNSRMPCRVIIYNMVYLTYAVLVLRMGIQATYFRSSDSSCKDTAPELFHASAAFVSLTTAAWATIILGYLLPFCFVASLLTWNGYSPTATTEPANNPFGVFTGAPPGCIDRLKTVKLSDFTEGHPPECCICMEDFCNTDEIIETKCKHVFHKQCCREWLKQARTCPVCRKDIASESNTDADDTDEQINNTNNNNNRPNIGFNSAGRSFEQQELREVVSLLRRIRRRGSINNHGRRLSETSQGSSSGTLVLRTSDIEDGYSS
eukprot:CAMPEP_0119571712 /NCGR_PEP_ID=MMETSP1352-20130426/44258_1 /TAXON_ID=265584 /ORGANISM="Stauroneis constricta, Strain CCMP1120" /LENGTH=902 /DNA_ID=CAMNT_0007621395 /DNA_START=192 /DNA_END=2900 /DNA_ORIENTATION=-